MLSHGLQGLIGAKEVSTTVSDAEAPIPCHRPEYSGHCVFGMSIASGPAERSMGVIAVLEPDADRCTRATASGNSAMNDTANLPTSSQAFRHLAKGSRVARRTFEMMYHYRQAQRLTRRDEAHRETAPALLMGWRETTQRSEFASAPGRFNVRQPLPNNEATAAALGEARPHNNNISISHWLSIRDEQGGSGMSIHAGLKGQHSLAGRACGR